MNNYSVLDKISSTYISQIDCYSYYLSYVILLYMKSTNQLAILEPLWVFLGFFLKLLFGLLKII